MNRHFVKARISLFITDAEAAVFAHVAEAASLVADRRIDSDDLALAYERMGPAFAAAFPARPDNPFDSFLDIFSDANHPRLGLTIEVGPANGSGRVELRLAGDRVDVGSAAGLLFAAAKSALPCGFQYAIGNDAAKSLPFGGGYVVITEAGIVRDDTADLLDRALARVSDEGADGFVLAVRDDAHGLSFWNPQTGFGRLYEARVFTEAEAANMARPQEGRSQWLAMPAPL